MALISKAARLLFRSSSQSLQLFIDIRYPSAIICSIKNYVF